MRSAVVSIAFALNGMIWTLPVLAQQAAPAASPVTAPILAAHDNLNATLWTQRSVEFKANALGAFHLARIQLGQGLKNKQWTAAPGEQKAGYAKLPPAVIVDIDETVLDNSGYQAWALKTGKSFAEDTWGAFCKTESSLPIPGAVDFLQFAVKRGVKVFYVTNRNADLEQATRNNLKKYGFPLDETEDTVLMAKERAEWTSTKGVRRAVIAQKYRIVLNIGDNFGDFVDDFRGSDADRLKVLNNTQGLWGRQWIAIANPTYGSWEAVPFGFNYKTSAEEQRKAKTEALLSWDGK